MKPLSKAQISVSLGRVIDGNCSVIVTAKDCMTGKIVSEEQIILARKVPAAPEKKTALPEACTAAGSGFSLILPDGSLLTSEKEETLLYRAATDNDTDLMFRNLVKPWYAQTESLVSSERIENGVRIIREVSNKKAKYTVTDTYEGTERGSSSPVFCTVCPVRAMFHASVSASA